MKGTQLVIIQGMGSDNIGKPDPDSHHIEKPDPHQSQKPGLVQDMHQRQNSGAVEAQNGTMEGRGCSQRRHGG